MEILDLYDEKGNKLGKTVERGNHPYEGYILLSIVFIRNSNGEYLIQKTSKEKDFKYTTTGGHVTSGEESLSCILRELEEEIGLKVNEHELKFIHLGSIPNRPYIFSVFLLEKDVDIDTLTLQKEEVAAIRWLSKNQILELIENGEFKESHGYLFKKYIMKKCWRD